MIDVLVSVSGLVSCVLVFRERTAFRASGDAARGRRGFSPLAGFVAVTALVYVNQVLFTVYMQRVHGGDPGFIARYMPPGWFDLALDNPALRAVAAHWPAPALLAPSVLRVQSFLELPFGLLAFGTVLRWLDAGLYRRVFCSRPLLWTASLSYTAVFCVVEWDLRSPYTVDDIVIRSVSAVVVPVVLGWAAARDRAESGVPSVGGLLVFAGSLGALGVLVLVVYDTALLYNLGRVPADLPVAVAAAAALAVLRLVAASVAGRAGSRGRAPGPAASFAHHVLCRWLLLFFVPALPIRYGFTFGTPLVAEAFGVVTGLVAVGWALRSTLGDGPDEGRRLGVLVGQLGCAVGCGAVAAYGVVRCLSAKYDEVVLLGAMGAFLAVALLVCAMTDRMVGRKAVLSPEL